MTYNGNRLTDKERDIAAACIEFVLAGEWPFEDDNKDPDVAESARNKLRRAVHRGKGEP